MLEKDADACGSPVLLRRETNRNAEERLHGHVERDAHPLNGAAQNHPLAMQLDMTHALVGHRIARREADGQSEGVEPRNAARPG